MADQTHDGNYTRVKLNAQIGDGPDQRGDVTVEVQGTIDEASPGQVRENAETELDGAVEHLRGVLGL